MNAGRFWSFGLSIDTTVKEPRSSLDHPEQDHRNSQKGAECSTGKNPTGLVRVAERYPYAEMEESLLPFTVYKTSGRPTDRHIGEAEGVTLP